MSEPAELRLDVEIIAHAVAELQRASTREELAALLAELQAHLEGREREHRASLATMIAETREDVRWAYRKLARARAEDDDIAAQELEAEIEERAQHERELETLRRLPLVEAIREGRRAEARLEAEQSSPEPDD